ncbi:MAG: hypothetical protein ACOCZL_01725 [Bacteroidota bacterium]
MKKTAGLFLLWVFLMLSASVDAQRWKLRRYEASLGIAGTNFFSDVGKSIDDQSFINNFKTVQLQTTRPGLTFGLRYKITGDMAAKFNLAYGFLHGMDGGNLDIRDYVISTTIIEPSLQFEYYLLPESRARFSTALFNRRGMINNYSRVYIYLFGGAGGTYYNAKAKKKIEVDPRFTAGSGFAPVLPAGIGLKFSIDAVWSIGLEYGRRFTFTDNLDGISTQFSENNDIYDFAVFKAIYKVRTDRRGRPMLRFGYGYRR